MKKELLFIVGCFICYSSLSFSQSIKNRFHDPKIRQIYTLQDARAAESLQKYFDDSPAKYRQAAVLAFASIQDSLAIQPIMKLLQDDDLAVRSAAAYTLGQIKHPEAEPILIRAFQTEPDPSVQRDILEALGKCGTEEGLEFLCKIKPAEKQSPVLMGQIWGIYRISLQEITSEAGTAKAVELSGASFPEKVRFIAGHYLSRTKNIDLTAYSERLIQNYKSEFSTDIQMCLVQAFGKVKQPEILDLLKSVVVREDDYRVIINAIRALGEFDYQEVKDCIFNLLDNESSGVAITAAEFFLRKGITEDAQKYFIEAQKIQNWRSRTIMLSAALKYVSAKAPISKYMLTVYSAKENIYERANLLKALAGDLSQHEFVAGETFSAALPVIRTYGLGTLVEMRQSENFAAKSENNSSGGQLDLEQQFASYFKKAILSDDVALVGAAAYILREPEMNYKNIFSNITFLIEALNRCTLPKDIETYRELQQTIAWFDDKEAPPLPEYETSPIDWNLVQSIPVDQRIKINTTKGVILIKLLVNDAPASVANFIHLIRSNYYRKNVFHRVAPNFVIQGGCPRGDGWGGPDYSIRSEFAHLYYQAGSVGMASAGKDTEASQWFITHSPTPHLDGRYTIFGIVEAGLENVHEIEMGDQVLGFEFLPEL